MPCNTCHLLEEPYWKCRLLLTLDLDDRPALIATWKDPRCYSLKRQKHPDSGQLYSTMLAVYVQTSALVGLSTSRFYGDQWASTEPALDELTTFTLFCCVRVRIRIQVRVRIRVRRVRLFHLHSSQGLASTRSEIHHNYIIKWVEVCIISWALQEWAFIEPCSYYDEATLQRKNY